MPLVPLRILLDHAAENDYGLAAFNVNNMEQIQAIMEAAKETDSPVIVQASRGARAYSQDNYLRHLMLAAAELYPGIPIAMHQDHGNSPATCESAIDNGFTSVMMDGSLKEDGKTPADFDYNVQVTTEVVKQAHSRGVSVEGQGLAQFCGAFGKLPAHVLLLRWIVDQIKQLILLRPGSTHFRDSLRTLRLCGSNVRRVVTFDELPVALANCIGRITGLQHDAISQGWPLG